jgi:hypothetical protein
LTDARATECVIGSSSDLYSIIFDLLIFVEMNWFSIDLVFYSLKKPFPLCNHKEAMCEKVNEDLILD